MDKYNFDISPNDSYPRQTDETIDINELLDSFSPDITLKKLSHFDLKIQKT